jgi:Cu+-exporting ATPase
LIEKSKAISACEVTYLPDEKGKGDIRVILAAEVSNYRNKFLISLAILVPILVLMWVIPYTNPSFLISYELRKGINAYILILCGLSTAIQFIMGAPFYSGAFKSVRNKSANMDVLVVLGTTAAWLYGVILIFMQFNDSNDQ